MSARKFKDFRSGCSEYSALMVGNHVTSSSHTSNSPQICKHTVDWAYHTLIIVPCSMIQWYWWDVLASELKIPIDCITLESVERREPTENKIIKCDEATNRAYYEHIPGCVLSWFYTNKERKGIMFFSIKSILLTGLIIWAWWLTSL